MSLRRSTKKQDSSTGHAWLAPLVLIAVVLAGCGTTPGPDKSTASVELGPDGQPIDTRVIPPRAQTLYEQAVAAMASGDFLDAQLRFQEFLLQYPSFPGAHVNLAIIYASNGDDLGAENSITDALMIDPEHPAALNQLGMLQRRQGKFMEAEFAYTKAVQADPEYKLAHFNLGVLNELYLQRLDIALQHYEIYQALGSSDKKVEKWIADLKRRIESDRRTASVTE
jgi:tetratricopeptide (TPR) repeat protein